MADERVNAAESTERRGRPRRFDDATEHRILRDPAIRLLRAHGCAEKSIADVLAQSGPSG